MIAAFVRTTVRVVVTFAFASSLAFAAEDDVAPSPDFRAHYPPASIDSVQKADTALADVARERARVEADYRKTSRACMNRFAVNTCLEDAIDLHRKRLGDLTAVQVEANRFKRHDKQSTLDAERARKDEERVAKDRAEAPARTQKQGDSERRRAQGAKDAATAASRAEKPRPKPRAKPVETTPEAAAAQSARHEKNATDYATKVKEADEHRDELERRRVQREAERAKKAQARAAKNGLPAPVPGDAVVPPALPAVTPPVVAPH